MVSQTVDRQTEKNNKRWTSIDVLKSGLAGGTAGCVAKTAIAPLDRLKLLFQTSHPLLRPLSSASPTDLLHALKLLLAQPDIYHGNAEGSGRLGRWDRTMRVLLQGHSATLARIFPYAAIKFVAYDALAASSFLAPPKLGQHVLQEPKQSTLRTRSFVLGALSGTAAVLATYPLELIRVRLAYQTSSTDPSGRPSILAVSRTILHETSPNHPSLAGNRPKSILDRVPPLKFYRGLSITLLGMVPYAGTSFLIYDSLKPVLALPQPFTSLVSGAVAGAVAQTVSYPFEVVRRQLQIGALTRPSEWLSPARVAADIYRTQGPRGFFVGLAIGYIKIIPMTAISFTTWTGMKHLLGV